MWERSKPLAHTAATLVVAAVGIAASQYGFAATLPVTCAASACANGPATWVTSGQASSATLGNTLQINQSTDRAILNWASFDIGADSSVIFNQPAASSLALNR